MKTTLFKTGFGLAITLMIMLGAVPGQAQSPVVVNRKFAHLSTRDGLSGNIIESIVQDKRGFMWIATSNGLNRYDGYTFTVYKNRQTDPTSLSANYARIICEGRDGTIWIGTYNGGLNQYHWNSDNFTAYRYEAANPQSLSSDMVNVVYEDQAGNLWVGTDKGLNLLDRQSRTFKRYQHNDAQADSLSHNDVRGIIEDQNGRLWISTYGGGLNLYQRESDTFTAYRHSPTEANSLSSDKIQANALIKDSVGNLWIGTDSGGLNKFTPPHGNTPATFTRYMADPKDPKSLPSNNVRGLAFNQDGTLWVGFRGQGVVAFDPTMASFTPYRHQDLVADSLSGDNTTVIYVDPTDMVWIGSSGADLNLWSRDKQKFRTYQTTPNAPNGLGGKRITSFYEDPNGFIWLTSRGEGLDKFDPKTGIFTHYRHDPKNPNSLNDDTLLAVIGDPTQPNILWIGTRNAGLDQLDIARGIFTHYQHDPAKPDSLASNVVWPLYIDAGKTLWLSVYQSGLDRFDLVNQTFTHYAPKQGGLQGSEVSMLLRAPDDTIWLAMADAGLAKFDERAQTFTHYRRNPDLKGKAQNDMVLAMYQDKQGIIWLGTDNGLSRFDQNSEQFTHFDETNGLSDPFVQCITGDGEYLWLSTTSRGLFRFNTKMGQFRNFDELDGLANNNMLGGCYRTAKGELFFGTANGFSSFFPQEIKDNAYVPPIVLTNFQIFNQPVPIGGDSPLTHPIWDSQKITLPHEKNILSLEFSALSYIAPQKNQYAYKLDGFDAEWRYTNPDRRLAVYTNLDPGTYMFRVRGSNNDGVWNERGASLTITITPPWWQTWWFRGIVGLTIIGLALTAYRWRVRNIEQRNKELETQVAARTRELSETNVQLATAKEKADVANQAKSAFLANMSHELRTPLNAILGFAQVMSRSQSLPAEHHDHLNIITRSGEHLLTLINQVLDLSKIEAGRATLNLTDFSLFALLDDLYNMFQLKASTKHLQLIFERSPDLPRYIRTDEVKLRQVLINLLSNAFKFTKEGGVTVRVDFGLPIADFGLAEQSKIQNLKSKILFEVADTGPGIASAELDKLFEAFVQTESGRQSQEGTGLGLPISRKFVQLMGGDIQVSSEVGRGTTFSFEIQVELPDSVDKPETNPQQRVIALEPNQPRYRLLIVDDNWANRQLLLQLLGPFGFELREASNGQEAVAVWDEWQPHLIFMDMRMPVLNGYEATKQIKATTKGQATLVIALTASTLEEERSVVLSAGCDAYMRKPFREAEIFEALTQYLGVRFVVEEIAPPVAPAPQMVLTADSFANLPKPWLVKFQQAVETVDMEASNALIVQIRPQAPSLANELADLVKNYRFDILQELVAQL